MASASFSQRLIPPSLVGIAIVIDDALAPGAAECGISPARKNDRVFDRDDALVVVTVQRPSLQLSAAESAFVHQQVEGMLVVIAFFAHGAQLGAQFIEREQVRDPCRLLQIELPSILRNFPACLAHLAILGACLIQHGVGVVDVYIDFTWAAELRQLAQAALVRRHRHMAHLPRGFSTPLNANQFVVAPESAIEQEHVGCIRIPFR